MGILYVWAMNLSFQHPQILWALLGLFVPVLLHLWHWQRLPTAYYPDLRWLSGEEKQGSAWKNWKHLLLLLIRCLAYFCLILALAKPDLGTSKTSALETLIFYDNQAMVEMAKALPKIPNKGSYKIEPWGQSSTQWQSSSMPATNDISALGYWKGPISATQWTAQMAWAQALHPQAELSIWSPFSKGLGLAKPPKNAQISWERISMPNLPNVVLDSLWLDPGMIQAKASIALHLRFKNWGNAPAKNLKVQAFVGKFMQSTWSFNLAIDASKEEELVLQMPAKGDLTLEIRSTDPLRFDNRYQFQISPSPTQSIWDLSGANSLWQKVFDDSPDLRWKSLDMTSWKRLSGKNEGHLMLSTASNFSPMDWKNCLDWIAKGNHMIFWPKQGQVLPPVLLQAFRQKGLQVQGSAKGLVLPIIKPKLGIPFFKAMLAKQEAGRDWQMWQAPMLLQVSESPGTLLSWINHQAYLTQISLGKGRISIFASDILQPTDGFKNHGLFLPIFQELVRQNAPQVPIKAINPSPKALSHYQFYSEEEIQSWVEANQASNKKPNKALALDALPLNKVLWALVFFLLLIEMYLAHKWAKS